MNELLEHPCADSHADEFIAWAAHIARPGSAYYSWELAIEFEGTLVGSVSTYMRQKDPAIGWWLGRSWRGRGFATEAARAVLPLAFAAGNLDEIRSYTGLNNLASKRVMEKLGFLVMHVGEQRVLTELTRERLEASIRGLSGSGVDA